MFENVENSQFTQGEEYDPNQDVDIWLRIIGSVAK